MLWSQTGDMGHLALGLWTAGQDQGRVMGSAAPAAEQPGPEQGQGAWMGFFVPGCFVPARSHCSLWLPFAPQSVPTLGTHRSLHGGRRVGL